MPRTVYLDHAATTPLDADVLAAMHPFLTEFYGNASSVHTLGRKARHTVENCRERVAALLGAEPGEILFTSGGSESNNLALKGLLAGRERNGLVTSAAEHEAVLQPAYGLARQQYPVTILAPEVGGMVQARTVAEAISEKTGLVSIMHTNNELGSLSPLTEIGAACHERGVPLHVDAVQAAGLFSLDVNQMPADALSLSAHKFYGPKGVGVLFVRAGLELHPLIEGGAQERRRRAGTENVAGIVGLTVALEKAQREVSAEHERLQRLQQRMVQRLDTELDGAFVLNTPIEQSAPHIVNLSFPPQQGHPLDGEMLLLNLDLAGVYVSSGSACTSGAIEPSHVLQAIGRSPDVAKATVRFSLGRTTTEEDLDYAVDELVKTVTRMRKLAAV